MAYEDNETRAYFALGRYRVDGYFLAEILAEKMGLGSDALIGIEFSSSDELARIIPEAEKRKLILPSLLSLERIVRASEARTDKSGPTLPFIYAQTGNPRLKHFIKSQSFCEIPINNL